MDLLFSRSKSTPSKGSGQLQDVNTIPKFNSSNDLDLRELEDNPWADDSPSARSIPSSTNPTATTSTFEGKEEGKTKLESPLIDFGSSNENDGFVSTQHQVEDVRDLAGQMPKTEFETPSHEILLLIYVHGFKGNDDSFGPLPNRLQSVLQSLIPIQTCRVLSLVYPKYETHGKLTEAVEKFRSWFLAVAEEEKKKSLGYQEGFKRVKTVLLAHSMGGIVLADCLASLKDSPVPARYDPPKILGVIAYDTPYFGLSPDIAKYQTEKYQSWWDEGQKGLKAINSISSLWGSGNGGSAASASTTKALTSGSSSSANASGGGWSSLAIGSVVGAGLLAAAGGAYAARNTLLEQYNWVKGHLDFIGELWDEGRMRSRVEGVVGLTRVGVDEARNTEIADGGEGWSDPPEEASRESREVDDSEELGFHCFYTQLRPTKPPSGSTSPPNTLRTFIYLPPYPKRGSLNDWRPYFTANHNSLAGDEIYAHVGMFDERTNDGSYELGQKTIALIYSWWERETRKRKRITVGSR